ncbi:MAG TPA: hypothetical protein VGH73_15635 [Thermoanaerobaculia bacterium]|jgi:hypothetical protein
MPNINSYADIFLAWENLVDSCTQNASSLAGAEPLRDELAAALAEVRTLKNNQVNLEGTRQALTQQLQQSVTKGQETARKLRAFVKSRLGTKSEHLPQFGMIPIRKRKVKPAAQTPPPPASGGTPAVKVSEGSEAGAPRNPTAA